MLFNLLLASISVFLLLLLLFFVNFLKLSSNLKIICNNQSLPNVKNKVINKVIYAIGVPIIGTNDATVKHPLITEKRLKLI